MGFLCRYPLIDYISVFICHLQMSSWKFFPCGKVCFRKFYRCRLIFKNKLIGNLNFFWFSILKSEFLFFIRCHKAIRRIDFFYDIGPIHWKICFEKDLSIFIRCFLLEQRSGFHEDFSISAFNIFFCK